MSNTDSSMYLPTPSVTAAINAVAATYLQMQAAAIAIGEQMDLTLDLVPTLSTTQNLARSHARLWTTNYETQLLQALTDAESFANTYAAFQPQLAAFAAAFDQGDVSARTQLVTGLQDLQSAVGRARSCGQTEVSLLKTFQVSLNDDAVRFATDAQSIQSKYTGPQGDLAKLQQQTSQLQAQLQKDNETIAKGATLALPGAMIAGVGVGIAYVNTSVGKVIAQAGLKMALGKLKEVDAAIDDAAKTVTQYQTLLQQQAGENLQAAVFQTLRAQVDSLSSLIQTALDNLAQCDAAWADVNAGLNVVLAMVQSGTPPDKGSIGAQLDAGLSFWNQTKSLVQALDQGLTTVTQTSGS